MLQAPLLDLSYLLGNELLPLHVAAQFRKRIGRDRLALGRARALQTFRRLLEFGVEVTDPKPRQGRLDAVDDAGLLLNEGLVLAVGALGIFLLKRRDGGHLAVITLAAQPAEKGAFELLAVEPVAIPDQ